MNTFYKALYSAAQGRAPFIVVTIIKFVGSTPRGMGAQMLIFKDGSIEGTIGGGKIEFEAQHLALNTFKTKESFIKKFVLRPNEIEDLGMVCGGNVSLYFQYFDPEDVGIKSFAEKLKDAQNDQLNSWIITDLTDENCFKMEIVFEKTEAFKHWSEQGVVFKRESNLLEKTGGGKRFFIKPFKMAGRVYIFGGGHIAKALVPVLNALDFSCTIMDDREEFASKTLFPEAESVLVNDFSNISKSVKIEKADYVVIMTRGHHNDFIVEAQALLTEAHYIGAIGSRHKTAAVNKRLISEKGFTAAELERVYTPIGKAIKAKTPAEIAISIAAELIEVRAEL
ncbi:MAG: XdhC family protein [Eubacterium sp.]